MLSEKWVLIKQDLYKIGKGFLIAVGGAICAYLGQVSGIIDYSQYGTFAPYIALGVSTICSTLINTIQKWMSTTLY